MCLFITLQAKHQTADKMLFLRIKGFCGGYLKVNKCNESLINKESDQ